MTCKNAALTTIEGVMLRQLNLLTLPTAISIASFEATFFVIADISGLTRGEVLLGLRVCPKTLGRIA